MGRKAKNQTENVDSQISEESKVKTDEVTLLDSQNNIEDFISELKIINQNLSKGDMTLDKMLLEYEKGISIFRKSVRILENAKLKLSEIADSENITL